MTVENDGDDVNDVNDGDDDKTPTNSIDYDGNTNVDEAQPVSDLPVNPNPESPVNPDDRNFVVESEKSKHPKPKV